jgi:predicted dehydrogenase
MTESLRVGVAGIGALGRHHARIVSSLPGVRAAGVYDVRADRAAAAGEEHGIPAVRDLDELISACDALIVATPTVTHHAVAALALGAGKHVLIEKPIAATLEEADDLLARAGAAARVLHVGHVERHNPAVDAAIGRVSGARFIEAHRLNVFTARSLDVDVVLDLMIHDLQIAQALVGRRVVDVRAAGVAVLTPKIDIANARIEFEGGCIANLTASRVSADRTRKFRVFGLAQYVSVDMAAQEIASARLGTGSDGCPAIVPEAIPFEREEPLRREVGRFVEACRGREVVAVSGWDGREALALALAVRAAIEEHQRRVQ